MELDTCFVSRAIRFYWRIAFEMCEKRGRSKKVNPRFMVEASEMQRQTRLGEIQL